tara:strand:- start:406 stop:591 length:186 start_codon:yes stop_codon:yes gene_type:complete
MHDAGLTLGSGNASKTLPSAVSALVQTMAINPNAQTVPAPRVFDFPGSRDARTSSPRTAHG